MSVDVSAGSTVPKRPLDRSVVSAHNPRYLLGLNATVTEAGPPVTLALDGSPELVYPEILPTL